MILDRVGVFPHRKDGFTFWKVLTMLQLNASKGRVICFSVHKEEASKLSQVINALLIDLISILSQSNFNFNFCLGKRHFKTWFRFLFFWIFRHYCSQNTQRFTNIDAQTWNEVVRSYDRTSDNAGGMMME